VDDLFGDAPAPAPRHRAMGSHQSAQAGTHTWLTPLPLVRALGAFDLDPCAYPGHDTAARLICWPDDGLAADWGADRVWLNPPYGHHMVRWLRRLAGHGHGTALIFARTETEAFFAHVWRAATALLFLEGRLSFLTPDGGVASGNSGAPSVLVAYGMGDADQLADSGLAGAFVPLVIPRSVVVQLIEPSWAGLVRQHLVGRGPVSLATLYRLVQASPKAARNPHWRAKVRQVLQQGVGQRVDRGIWEAA
jgi:hypothetical protein